MNLRHGTRFGRLLERGAVAVAITLFAATFAVFVTKIAARYVLGWSLAWADEVSQVLFVSVVFWTCATLMPDARQIRFSLVADMLPPRARRLCAAAGLLVVGGLFAAALPACLDYLWFLRQERTPVLRLPLSLVYACFGLFMAATVLRCAAGLWRLARRPAA